MTCILPADLKLEKHSEDMMNEIHRIGKTRTRNDFRVQLSRKNGTMLRFSAYPGEYAIHLTWLLIRTEAKLPLPVGEYYQEELQDDPYDRLFSIYWDLDLPE